MELNWVWVFMISWYKCMFRFYDVLRIDWYKLMGFGCLIKW